MSGGVFRDAVPRRERLTMFPEAVHSLHSMKVICIIAVIAGFFSCLYEPRAELVNGIEAIVDDSVITYYEVSARNEQTYETLARDY